MIRNVVIDQPSARSLPSRRHFAIAKLLAYARWRHTAATPPAADRLILTIEADQTTAEMNAVAIWIFGTAVCYFAALLPFHPALALLAAVPLAAIAVQLPFLVGGPLLLLMLGDGNHIRIVSLITMAAMTIASSYLVTTSSWARFPAWIFFGVLVVNGVAAFVNLFLRRRFQQAEEQCVR